IELAEPRGGANVFERHGGQDRAIFRRDGEDGVLRKLGMSRNGARRLERKIGPRDFHRLMPRSKKVAISSPMAPCVAMTSDVNSSRADAARSATQDAW